MIGWLSGVARAGTSNGATLVDVHGVGYEVVTAHRCSPGDVVELFVLTVVRADSIVLYGFRELREREFFSALTNVPGIGPATAMTALRTLSLSQLAGAISRGDVSVLTKIPGIGAKTAQRMVIELKGKFSENDAEETSTSSTVIAALTALGYESDEITEALADFSLPDDEATALRTILQRMAKQ